MADFKPMVKMYTTEPEVELKLKKGGSASFKKLNKMKAKGDGTGHKMMDGGPTIGLRGAPVIASSAPKAVVAVPRKPSMAERMRAMRGRPMVAALMKEGGESKAEHKAEMKTAKELKKHESMPASKAHKGLKKGGKCYSTGGVAMGQGGYKKGGKVKKADGGTVATTTAPAPAPSKMPPQSNKGGASRGLERAAEMSGRTMPTTGKPATTTVPAPPPTRTMKKGGNVIKSTKGKTTMHTAKRDTKGGTTGAVKRGNAGGYAKGGGVEGNVSSTPAGRTNTKTGGVRLGQGGYKKGGKAKRYADGGGVDTQTLSQTLGATDAAGVNKPYYTSDNAGTSADSTETLYGLDDTNPLFRGDTSVLSPAPAPAPAPTPAPSSAPNPWESGQFMPQGLRGKENLPPPWASGKFMPPGLAKKQGTTGPVGRGPKKADDGGMMGNPSVGGYAQDMGGRPMGLPSVNPITGRAGLPIPSTSGRIYDPRQAAFSQPPGWGGRPFAKGGSVNDSGRPEKMPQGRKPPTPMVRLTQLTGTFKKGGKVKK